MPTVAIPAKLKVVYKLLDYNDMWRASFRYAGIHVRQK